MREGGREVWVCERYRLLGMIREEGERRNAGVLETYRQSQIARAEIGVNPERQRDEVERSRC